MSDIFSDEVVTTLAPKIVENIPYDATTLWVVFGITVASAFAVELIAWACFCLPIPGVSEGDGMKLHTELVQKTREYELLTKSIQSGKPKESEKRKQVETFAELEELHTNYQSAKMKSTAAGTIAYFVGMTYLKKPFLGHVVAKFPFNVAWPISGMLQQSLESPTAQDCSMVGIFMLGLQFLRPLVVEVLHLSPVVKPSDPSVVEEQAEEQVVEK
eukprot:GHVH01004679.1.p1 GENE.GHVH01004679.1~~GHVH01004679.1.p1  ORF type:complete len:224 (+),score=28.12 GHVH01004679.1:29-673(+)